MHASLRGTAFVVRPGAWGRLGIALLILAVYWLGTRIPLPGLDPATIETVVRASHAPVSMQLLSIFGLGITPVLSAFLCVEAARLIAPPFAAWERRTPDSAAQLDFFTAIIALIFCVFQAGGIASAMPGIDGLVEEPGRLFRVTCVVTLMAATAFLTWIILHVTALGRHGPLWLLACVFELATLLKAGLIAASASPDAHAMQTSLPLNIAYVAAAGAVCLLIFKQRGDDSEAGPVIWPVLLSYAMLGWFILPLAFVLPAGWFDHALAWTAPGHPLRIAFVAVLVPLIYAARERLTAASVKQSDAQAGSNSRWTSAALLTAFVLAGEALIVLKADAMFMDARTALPMAAALLAIIGLACRAGGKERAA